ncbi:MAG: NAD(P)/FAD-dependent oxidoreductase [Spongiibacteraceae bacterium]
MSPAKKIAIIGAGPMGLAAAYELSKRGHHVTIFEKAAQIGGMSVSFDFDGLQIERYYHFVCATDHTLFRYLDELGITKALHWTKTRMGFYFNGRLYDWGHPFALLKFDGLGLVAKARYALHVMYTRSIKDWRALDKISATEWLHKWLGIKGYDVLWRSLFYYKFYELQNELSAAWLGTRIKRVALSRKSLLVEEMGYLEGGSDTLLVALEKNLRALNCEIRLAQGIDEIVIQDGKVQGVRIGDDVRHFDQVISTAPLPYLVKMAPALPPAEHEKIAAIRNVGVVCVILKLKNAFTHNFWMNINDPRIEIPGLIEYSNLNPLGHAIVYAPYYMPQTNPKYMRDPQAFIDETLAYMKLIRPDFDPAQEVLAATASRYEYSQTVCSPNFYDALPPMQSAVTGLFLADTSHYYPEDRSITESLQVGCKLAELAMAQP